MEQIASNILSEAFEALPHKQPKDFYICPTSDFALLGELVQSTSQHFGLFLALDARALDDTRISTVGKMLLQNGLAYLCAWGPDCERVHDAFDKADLETGPKQTKDVVMTTSHSGETMGEALWFFVNCASPEPAYERTCKDWIIVPVGHAEWEKDIRSAFVTIRERALHR